MTGSRPNQPRAGFPHIASLVAVLLAGYILSAAAATESEHTIETSLGDTETFWLQIPADYDPDQPCPLLVGWHQWGGDHLEMRNASDFDEIADSRGWIAASHQGVSTTHWNNHPTQSHVVDVIAWIQERYAVDPSRIYMVGASMGGAAAMIFANNHLDPAGPRVAAAASLSGIQDCERRFHEQGVNNSMIAAFGGTPAEVPFEYHRNSAICFDDSTASMHPNARHLPLWLTFGHGDSDQIWREHAEDLYAVLAPLADTVVLRESAYSGHGWSCGEEHLICDFLARFTLDPLPADISINADAPGSWGWADLEMRAPAGQFARFDARVRTAESRVEIAMIHNVARLDLDLAALAFPYESGEFAFRWDAGDEGAAELALRGVPAQPGLVLRDGQPFAGWSYDPGTGLLLWTDAGAAEYRVLLDPAAVGERLPGAAGGPAPGPAAAARPAAVLVTSLILSGGGVSCRWPAGPEVSWTLFDALGRTIASGAEPARSVETRTPLLLPARLSSGIYLLRLQRNDGRPAHAVRRLTVVR